MTEVRDDIFFDIVFFPVSLDFAETLVFFDLPPVFFGLEDASRFVLSILGFRSLAYPMHSMACGLRLWLCFAGAFKVGINYFFIRSKQYAIVYGC